MKSAVFILIMLSALILTACTSPESGRNAPADHTVNKNGFFHNNGLNDPGKNCISCHGDDLRGGTSGISCFSCHGEIW